jgi:alpha-D-xyloside xylohydrolase
MTGFKCLGAGPRDKEIFIRWLELGAVSPIMMDQNACSNPLEKRTKWGLFNDEETIDAWRRMASLHTRLQPYFLTLAREAAATGMPLMRHPVLVHPHRPEALQVEDAYFLGPALYAAPVVRRGVTVRRVWLPPGRYVSFDEGTVYEGGREVDLPAPLDRLPLLLVAGQLLPLLDASVQTLAPASVPGVVTADSLADVLDVRAALAPGQVAQLTLADGTTLRAERAGAAGDALGVATAATVASCEQCALEEPSRLRVNARGPVAAGGVRFSTDRPGRRLRWDVALVPD